MRSLCSRPPTRLIPPPDQTGRSCEFHSPCTPHDAAPAERRAGHRDDGDRAPARYPRVSYRGIHVAKPTEDLIANLALAAPVGLPARRSNQTRPDGPVRGQPRLSPPPNVPWRPTLRRPGPGFRWRTAGRVPASGAAERRGSLDSEHPPGGERLQLVRHQPVHLHPPSARKGDDLLP